jgi:hypothetical protein
MNMRKILAIVGALIAVGLGITVLSTAQQALADRVGPNGEKEDQFTQGALGEFFSNEGKDEYYDASGQEFGDVRGDIANSDSEVIGANSAYYASGECHSDTERKACK